MGRIVSSPIHRGWLFRDRWLVLASPLVGYMEAGDRRAERMRVGKYQ
jgi:hypothetical protein